MRILYLGYSGFPYGLAELQKILLISKSLINEGSSVIVLGSRGIHEKCLHPELKKVGHFNGIIYINSSGTPFRDSRFLKRNLKKFFEKILEFNVINELHKRNKIDVAIISSMNFRHLLCYWLLSRILGFKVLLNFVEYNSSIPGRQGAIIKLNDYLFDHYAVRISDGILVISEYLINVIKRIDPGKKYLKIPMMVDVDRYLNINPSDGEDYFLFCGAADYKEVILFIVESFEILKDDNILLYMVINGSNEQMLEIQKRIAISNKSNLIRFFSKLSETKLSLLYKNAIGLLIPLRPTVQDEARFPHKIGEYLASGNPVITTNYGEVKYYLKDFENALVAERYNINDFAEKMEFVITNPSESKSIGQNGRKVALQYADYKQYGIKIINLIKAL